MPLFALSVARCGLRATCRLACADQVLAPRPVAFTSQVLDRDLEPDSLSAGGAEGLRAASLA